MGVAHAVGVGFEVGHGFVHVGGLGSVELVETGGGREGFDVAVVQVGESPVQPGSGVGHDECELLGERVQVFAGVEQVDDAGGGGEALVGEVPDPAGAVAEDDELADVFGAAAAGFGLQEVGEHLDRVQGGQVAGRVRIAYRPVVLVGVGLGEQAGEFGLAGAGPPVGVFAGPSGGFGWCHRDAGAVDGEVEHVRDRAGRR